ncbi:hypothetical protein BC834DRAFT_965562 [Gloeopeniophorella convolvens]|nr:hypothetical protein BC834DRAFT_965562 [Gloeopeniophorella convolvens]
MTSGTEVRFTPYGIPYIVEFANVSIWPRPPMTIGDVTCNTPDLASISSTLSRSNTLPNISTHKPLPSLPRPTRSNSLKVFRDKALAVVHAKQDPAFKEPEPVKPVVRRRTTLTAEARNSAHRHFKVFNDEFSASEETLVDLEDTIAFAPPNLSPVAPADGLSLRTGALYIQFAALSGADPAAASLPQPSALAEVEGASPTLADSEKATRRRLYQLSRAISKAVLAAGMEAPQGPARKFDMEGDAVGDTGAKEVGAHLTKRRQGLFKGTYGQVRAAFREAGLVTTPCGEDGVPEATRLGALFVANPDGHGAIVFTKVVMWG